MHRHDIIGRIVGMLVFLAGVGLLVLVFVMAHGYFTSDSPGSHITASGPGVSATTRLGESALRMIGRVALLVVMAIVASLIAARGIQMYFASAGRARPAIEDATVE